VLENGLKTHVGARSHRSRPTFFHATKKAAEQERKRTETGRLRAAKFRTFAGFRAEAASDLSLL